MHQTHLAPRGISGCAMNRASTQRGAQSAAAAMRSAARRARFALASIGVGACAATRTRISSSSSRNVATAAAANDDSNAAAPPGCARYTVELRRPLGIVLEQRGASGGIFVVDITPGGAADRTGKVSMGDQLIATTGITYNKIEDYNGVMVRKGQEVVTLNVLNESFKTVSAAIGTHPASVPVRLTFQRCDDASAAAASSRD